MKLASLTGTALALCLSATSYADNTLYTDITIQVGGNCKFKQTYTNAALDRIEQSETIEGNEVIHAYYQAHDANGELLFTSTPVAITAGAMHGKANKAGGFSGSQKITESGQLTTESWQAILQRACAENIVISPFAHHNLQQTTIHGIVKQATSSAPQTGSAKLTSKAAVDVFTLNPNSIKESGSPSQMSMNMAYKNTPITVRYAYKENMSSK